MSTEWSHLPNAAHIDRVLAHLKAHPEKWVAARKSARESARESARVAAWVAARKSARESARESAWVAARDAAWVAAWESAWVAAWVAARVAARDAARDATAALVVYDEGAYLLDYDAPALRALIRMQPDNHAAVLLLPAVVAMKEK